MDCPGSKRLDLRTVLSASSYANSGAGERFYETPYVGASSSVLAASGGGAAAYSRRRVGGVPGNTRGLTEGETQLRRWRLRDAAGLLRLRAETTGAVASSLIPLAPYPIYRRGPRPQPQYAPPPEGVRIASWG